MCVDCGYAALCNCAVLTDFLMRFKLLSIFCFWTFFCCGSSASSKHAVVIGIGEYRDSSWRPIHGDRDVPLVVEMLRELDYGDIVCLVNGSATKAGIVTAFEKLIERCNKNDVVYIHFSGHGQRMTDVNGDEDDGWDEAWIPYDACMCYDSNGYRGENHLSDDEISSWMTKLRNKIGPGGIIAVVVDACHSGDSSRGLNDSVCIRGVEQNFVIPVKERVRCEKVKEDWLTLSACKDYQLNCEIKTANGYFGMLTYALYMMYSKLWDMDNWMIVDILKQYVDRYRGPLPQTPCLTGETGSYLLRLVFAN